MTTRRAMLRALPAASLTALGGTSKRAKRTNKRAGVVVTIGRYSR